MKESIISRIQPDLRRIEEEIELLLTTSVPLISVVGRYIMGSGGKRLRPLLLVLSARLCGYQGSHDASLAVVFEFIHAASLLHDDVVDHAKFRRNRPAANTVWGNQAVVLVGDFLYSKAIHLTVGYNSLRMLEVLSEATTRMSEGEVLQLVHADNIEISEEEYIEVITRKTAVLISAACQIGALFGGNDVQREKALKTYGHNLGIAFQLVDDTLDYTGDVKELGKPVGNDIQEGKATLPLICALRNGKPGDRARLREVFSSEQLRKEDFAEIKELVTRSGGLDYTLRLASRHIQTAKQALGIFPPHPTRDLLSDIADYVICRRM
ncbi:MAG TPA: polyprenyl synthetase family protein [Syntrophobacter fumaroxidans]|nr:polyprenyl synthetase family protein [Syntrophobacter fumaroxidans]